jgi:NADPH-dependent ferric siderophore reductase
MIRLTVSSPGLAEMKYVPGQDFTVLVARANGRDIRRRYTLAGRDGDAVYLDIYVHGEGIGTAWARARRPGDAVSAIGPRGSFILGPPADWDMHIGDETSLPGIRAMLSATDAAAHVIIEVDDPDEWESLRPRGDAVRECIWLERGSRRPEAEVLAMPTTGQGHAYISGEAARVLAWRAALKHLGMDESAVTHKAYWGTGRANATHGEPLA